MGRLIGSCYGEWAVGRLIGNCYNEWAVGRLIGNCYIVGCEQADWELLHCGL